MSKTVSANEAKNRFGSLLGYVDDEHDEVIVERHGKPKAALISFAAYQELQELREQKRRADALARLKALEERISERNKDSDLTEEQTIELSVQISREMFNDMAARGELRIERDERDKDRDA